MTIDPALLEAAIREMLAAIPAAQSAAPAAPRGDGVFADMDGGLTTVEYSAYGVIGAITPTTNPTETVTCNAIGMLAAGNAVVFSPHPRAKSLTLWQVQTLNRALHEVGAPDNLIVTVAEPSIENTNKMIAHPGVKMLVATGGPGPPFPISTIRR